MIIEAVFLIVGAYLLGSVSSAYLVGRWFGGRDLRQYGSGNLGQSMVWEHVGHWQAIVAGLFDLIKAAGPTWLGLKLGLGWPVAAGAGLAAVAGHSWSIYLGFTGGRGMLSFLGMMLLVVYPWGAAWLAGVTIFGWILGDSAPWLLAALITIPLLAHFLGGPAVVNPIVGAMTLMALAKRIEANRQPWPPTRPERIKVLLRRTFLDRDIASHKDWIERQPDASEKQSS
jgi:glycerol-3-phosphate acyltransferase PlsY